MFIMSVYSSEYLHSRRQDYVQMCRYLVLYDCLLLCNFFLYYCICSIIRSCSYSITFPKRNLYLNTHCVTVKSVSYYLNISYRRHVCNCRLTTGFHINTIYRYNYSFSPYRILCGPTVTGSKHTATVLPCYHINIILTQSDVPSVNTQLQSCHVIIKILP